MSELLNLADHYYVVARDLMVNGERTIETAKMLAKIADALCEQNIAKEAAAAPSPAEPKEKPE
jgi:hypothetical protein